MNSFAGKGVAAIRVRCRLTPNIGHPKLFNDGAMGEGYDIGGGQQKAFFMKYPNGGTTYTKLIQIVRPADKFVMLDEKGDLINDGALYVDCSVSGDTLFDVPGNYHNTGTAFNYADGHSDVHRWKDPNFYNATTHDTHPGIN